MSHDTEISPRFTTSATTAATIREPHASAAGAATASAGSRAPGIEQQRRALQGRVEALRQRGALAAAGQPASALQWNNWSNG